MAQRTTYNDNLDWELLLRTMLETLLGTLYLLLSTISYHSLSGYTWLLGTETRKLSKLSKHVVQVQYVMTTLSSVLLLLILSSSLDRKNISQKYICLIGQIRWEPQRINRLSTTAD